MDCTHQKHNQVSQKHRKFDMKQKSLILYKFVFLLHKMLFYQLLYNCFANKSKFVRCACFAHHLKKNVSLHQLFNITKITMVLVS